MGVPGTLVKSSTSCNWNSGYNYINFTVSLKDGPSLNSGAGWNSFCKSSRKKSKSPPPCSNNSSWILALDWNWSSLIGCGEISSNKMLAWLFVKLDPRIDGKGCCGVRTDTSEREPIIPNGATLINNTFHQRIKWVRQRMRKTWEWIVRILFVNENYNRHWHFKQAFLWIQRSKNIILGNVNIFRSCYELVYLACECIMFTLFCCTEENAFLKLINAWFVSAIVIIQKTIKKVCLLLVHPSNTNHEIRSDSQRQWLWRSYNIFTTLMNSTMHSKHWLNSPS